MAAVWIYILLAVCTIISATAKTYNILDFGAVPDGKTLCTRAMETAIAQIARDGGGTLEIPAGRFLTAPFNMTSRMTLLLSSPNSVLLATDDPALWPVVPALPSYGRGREKPGPRYTSFVHGEHLTDITITGPGTIDGNARWWWDAVKQGKLNYTRGNLIEFMFCTNIVLTHFTSQNSPFWNVHPYASKNIYARWLKLLNPYEVLNTDGFDPDSSQNVTLMDTIIVAGDDGVAIKSGWDEFGYNFGMPSANIYINNVTITASGCGVCIGSEMSGGVENVTVEFSVWPEAEDGIRIKSARGRGGYVRNITWRDIIVHDAVDSALLFTDDYNDHPKPINQSAVPIIDNILVQRVRFGYSDMAAKLVGLPDAVMTNIVLDSVHVENSLAGFTCQYIKGSARDVYPQPCAELVPAEENGELTEKQLP